jgi:receptor protein-tyrosine kinase/non-specific protein-tyrosine kinase
LDIRQWTRLVWRRKWLLFGIVIVIPVAVYLGSSLLPKSYQSSATVNVRATAAGATLLTRQIGSASDIVAAQTLIKTAAVGRRAARLMGRDPDEARALIGQITVTQTNPSETAPNFLTITARDPNPVAAARIANAFARAVARTRTSNAIRQIDRLIVALEAQTASGVGGKSTRDALALQLQQLRGLRAGQGGTTPIIEAAVPATAPISPRPRRNTAVALILALLIAAALAPLLDRLDRHIREPGELEEVLKAPLLAMIPDDAFPGHPPGAHVRESFQTLRASLTYFNVDRPLSTLVVTSPIQQDGKTTVAVNLALAYALDERNVVLVDADLRRPQVAVRLGKEVSVGLEAVLAGERTLQEALVDVDAGAGRLRILPGVTPPPNPAVLLGSQRMRLLLAELAEQADVVVIDTPGLLAVSDAIPLINQAAGSLVVARLNRTTKEAMRRANQVIAAAGGTVLGAVATGAHAGGIYGYYGYGDYGDYGGADEDGGADRSKNGSAGLRGLAPRRGGRSS